MGNLADELDQLDDDYDYEEDVTEHTPGRNEGAEDESLIDGARDSGIDVSYSKGSIRTGSPHHIRNFSKPIVQEEKPPDEGDSGSNGSPTAHHIHQDGELDDRFSRDLEELFSSVAHMASSTANTTEDALIPRTTALLQDLGNQTGLEAGVQRFSTSANSFTAYVGAQTKTLQVLSQSLFSPFHGFAALQWNVDADEILPLLETLLNELPQPDPASPAQQLAKLTRDTADVLAALAALTDTLQLGKQMTTAAARHLRTTQTMVAELLQERVRADEARAELENSTWPEKARKRFCGDECRDIVQGFERRCEELRVGLAGEAEVAAAAVTA